MSFVLKQKATFTWPVTIVLPIDGGHKEKSTFDCEFKRLPQSRINEIIKVARLMEVDAIDEEERLEDQGAAKEILCGWSGVVDDKGNDIKFSEAKLNELLEIPTVASQIVKAWFLSLEVSKRKN